MTGSPEPDAGVALFRRILGPAFDTLPAPLKALHGAAGPRRWAGTASVRRGASLPSRLIAALLRLPAAGDDVPVSVAFAPEGGGERWTRDFGGHVLASVLAAGGDPDRPLLVERLGPVRLSFALVPDEDRLLFVPRRWSLFGVPMPRRLLPAGESFESAEADGRFVFDIAVAMPVAGLVIAYRGTLVPA